MKTQTETAVRNILEMDDEVVKQDIERAIDVLRGKKDETGTEGLVQVLRRKDVMNLLRIHRRTLDYYIDMGYLDRVYGGGKKAIGISRESFIRFTTRRVVRNTGRAKSAA